MNSERMRRSQNLSERVRSNRASTSCANCKVAFAERVAGNLEKNSENGSVKVRGNE